MARPIPGRDEVLQALDRLHEAADRTGRLPSVLTLAGSVGMANTTFRRNFPDIVAEISAQTARRPQPAPPPSRYAELQESVARLRADNRELRGQLGAATAVIQRIALENHRLRQELEAAAAVTRIGPVAAHERQGSEPAP
jgi:hypothetical protein